MNNNKFQGYLNILQWIFTQNYLLELNIEFFSKIINYLILFEKFRIFTIKMKFDIYLQH